MKRGFEDKKGQAFLIGAVLLIAILVSLVTLSNESEVSGFSTIELQGEKIDTESEKVMDYALLNKNSNENLNSTAIEGFTNETSNSLSQNTEIFFIENSSYTGNSGPIECYKWNSTNQKEHCQTQIQNQNIIATIKETNHTFPKTQGKHFYFVMINEDQGERYIYKNA